MKGLILSQKVAFSCFLSEHKSLEDFFRYSGGSKLILNRNYLFMISLDLNEANLPGIMFVVIASSTQRILIDLFRFVDESCLVACAGLLNGFSVLIYLIFFCLPQNLEFCFIVNGNFKVWLKSVAGMLTTSFALMEKWHFTI